MSVVGSSPFPGFADFGGRVWLNTAHQGALPRQQLGRLAETRAEFERAATLTRNGRERALLLDRAASCAPPR